MQFIIFNYLICLLLSCMIGQYPEGFIPIRESRGELIGLRMRMQRSNWTFALFGGGLDAGIVREIVSRAPAHEVSRFSQGVAFVSRAGHGLEIPGVIRQLAKYIDSRG